MIERQIALLQKNGIKDIVVIIGPNKEMFTLKNVEFVNDIKHNDHEQVGSLMAAKSKISGNVIITYADILFEDIILHQILDSKADITVAVDLDWRESYNERTDNPIFKAGKVLIKDRKILKISENISLNEENYIAEFLGILKLSANGSKILLDKIQELENHHNGKFHDAESFKMAKLTDLLQELIESKVNIEPIFVKGKWCEVDTVKDLERARKLFK